MSPVSLDESRLSENPVSRLSRMIRTSFWDGLTRRIDADGLELICTDPKNRSANQSPRIYVPEAEPEMIEYYRKVAADKPHIKLEVVPLPHDFDARYVKDLNHNPGILALAMKKAKAEDGNTTLQGIPFVVRKLAAFRLGFLSCWLISGGPQLVLVSMSSTTGSVASARRTCSDKNSFLRTGLLLHLARPPG